MAIATSGGSNLPSGDDWKLQSGYTDIGISNVSSFDFYLILINLFKTLESFTDAKPPTASFFTRTGHADKEKWADIASMDAVALPLLSAIIAFSYVQRAREEYLKYESLRYYVYLFSFESPKHYSIIFRIFEVWILQKIVTLGTHRSDGHECGKSEDVGGLAVLCKTFISKLWHVRKCYIQYHIMYRRLR